MPVGGPPRNSRRWLRRPRGRAPKVGSRSGSRHQLWNSSNPQDPKSLCKRRACPRCDKLGTLYRRHVRPLSPPKLTTDLPRKSPHGRQSSEDPSASPSAFGTGSARFVSAASMHTMNYRLSRLFSRCHLARWLPLVWLACQAGPLPAAEPESRRSALVVAVELARSSIVNIHGEKTVPAENPYAENSTAKSDAKRVNGMGTGVIVDERGYIMTNFHVVDGVKKITVTSAERETYIAQLVSRDAKTDLAIIKIDAHGKLPVIEIGTSSDLMPGETVIAVGNAYGYEHTVTRGIISALHRTVQVSDAQNYEDLIQTDASINPGNSGGPLLNIEGKMIGLNVAVRAGAQGIGFAIPADKVVGIAADLLSTRRLDHTWHGLVARPVADGEEGVVLDAVDAESPAAESGLQSGDVIKAVGKQHVWRVLDVERAMLGRHPGEKIAVEVRRNGQPLSVSLVLASAPDGR